MAYTALARRYRSQSFGEVVGQEPIAQTLQNAIASDRLHHAYLSTGTRGVGKTTMARLFARALNAPDTIEGCPKPEGVEYPPEDVQGRMAEAIMRGDDMNVIEIDGASNRGVDDARQLIANAALAPTAHARFKVYIIDEVHMLTREAFNALLKTMEEPPSHLKFILCTTEPQKVLPTIHSRCQRFDFHNIPTGRIVEHLKQVLEAEKVGADEAVLFQVARQGNGSMRDALSLLDRLLASGEDPLTGDLLARMLGLPDAQLIADLAKALADGDAAAALGAADALLKHGVALDQLLEGLIEHLRHVMLLAACGAQSDLVELDESGRAAAAELASKFDTPALVHAIAMLETVQRHARTSATPRALVDAALVRLALSDSFADLASLLAGRGGVQKKKPLSVETRPAPQAVRPAPAKPAAPVRPAAQPPAKPADRPADAASSKRKQVLTQDERDQVMRMPLVRQVAELFDATLIDVRHDEPAEPPPPEEKS